MNKNTNYKNSFSQQALENGWKETQYERCNESLTNPNHFCHLVKGHKGEHATWYWLSKNLFEWEIKNGKHHLRNN